MSEWISTHRRQEKHYNYEIEYNSYAKKIYRDRIWTVFKDLVLTPEFLKDPKQVVLLLPSSNGEEIEVALNKGFPLEKLVTIDENPQMKWYSTWGEKYPKIKFYGCMARYVRSRIKEDNLIIKAANLDFCNNFSFELMNQVRGFCHSYEMFEGNLILAVTVSKGREPKRATSAMNKLLLESQNSKIQEKRISALITAVGDPNPKIIDQGIYTNQRFAMAWGMFDINPNKLKFRIFI